MKVAYGGRFFCIALPFPVAEARIGLILRGNDMTRQQVLDLYFLDARHKLVELAAFLDRVERAAGADDFRLMAFRAALGELSGRKKQKAKRVLLAFSDPTAQPIALAPEKGACGAWRGSSRITHHASR
jgi:hypothetical protein